LSKRAEKVVPDGTSIVFALLSAALKRRGRLGGKRPLEDLGGERLISGQKDLNPYSLKILGSGVEKIQAGGRSKQQKKEVKHFLSQQRGRRVEGQDYAKDLRESGSVRGEKNDRSSEEKKSGLLPPYLNWGSAVKINQRSK